MILGVAPWGFDEANRLAGIRGAGPMPNTTHLYDGRSFLGRAQLDNGSFLANVIPTYSSAGRLFHTERTITIAAPDHHRFVLYLADRPVATLDVDENGAGGFTNFELRYLTTDHLGTPILATDNTGQELWEGGFEPFGADFSGASDQGVFLRFPGQWTSDEIWDSGFFENEIYQNVYRWYDAPTGTYVRTDPLGVLGGGPGLYSYAVGNPVGLFDRYGLAVVVDDSLQPFVECARSVPFFDMAWQWFVTNGDWKLRPISQSPTELLFGQTTPLDSGPGIPDCKQGGIFYPDDRRTPNFPPTQACGFVVEAIAHEVIETYAYCSLGMTTSQAHTFVQRGPKNTDNGLDDDVSRLGCSTCRCQDALSQ